MRDIKFRAWDHVNNVMLHANFGEVLDIGEEWTAWDLPIESPTNTGMPFEVMEFTGLTDKNGVEIYEGDIVSGRDSDAEVKLFHGCWMAFYGEHKYFNVHFHLVELEVIGNIYQPNNIT